MFALFGGSVTTTTWIASYTPDPSYQNQPGFWPTNIALGSSTVKTFNYAALLQGLEVLAPTCTHARLLKMHGPCFSATTMQLPAALCELAYQQDVDMATTIAPIYYD